MSSIWYMQCLIWEGVSACWKIQPEPPSRNTLAVLQSQSSWRDGLLSLRPLSCTLKSEKHCPFGSLSSFSLHFIYHMFSYHCKLNYGWRWNSLSFTRCLYCYPDFPATMTFSSFSLKSVLFAVSFLPPYLIVTSLSCNHGAGKKSKDTVWKCHHRHSLLFVK